MPASQLVRSSPTVEAGCSAAMSSASGADPPAPGSLSLLQGIAVVVLPQRLTVIVRGSAGATGPQNFRDRNPPDLGWRPRRPAGPHTSRRRSGRSAGRRALCRRAGPAACSTKAGSTRPTASIMRSPRFTTFLLFQISQLLPRVRNRTLWSRGRPAQVPGGLLHGVCITSEYRHRRGGTRPSQPLRKAEMAPPQPAASACSSGPPGWGGTQPAQSGQRDRVPCRPRRRAEGAGICCAPPAPR